MICPVLITYALAAGYGGGGYGGQQGGYGGGGGYGQQGGYGGGGGY
jgi:hypothetical protein